MTDFKYKAIGPRGAEYLTETLQEALELTKSGGTVEKLGARSRGGFGRPKGANSADAGDVFKVMKSWTQQSHGVELTFEVGDHVEVSQILRGGAAFEIREKATGETASVDSRLFLLRVKPLVENAGGRKLGRVVPYAEDPLEKYELRGNEIWDTEEGESVSIYAVPRPIYNFQSGRNNQVPTESEFLQGGGAGEGAIVRFLMADEIETQVVSQKWPGDEPTPEDVLRGKAPPPTYDKLGRFTPPVKKSLAIKTGLRWGAVNKTARYMMKRILNDSYKHEEAINFWICAAAAGVREVALIYGIDNYAAIYDNASVRNIARMLAYEMMSSLKRGELVPEELNIFADIRVDGSEEDWESGKGISWSRDRFKLVRNPSPQSKTHEREAPWLPHGVSGDRKLRLTLKNPSDTGLNEEEKAKLARLISVFELVFYPKLVSKLGESFAKAQLVAFERNHTRKLLDSRNTETAEEAIDPAAADEKESFDKLKDAFKRLAEAAQEGPEKALGNEYLKSVIWPYADPARWSIFQETEGAKDTTNVRRGYAKLFTHSYERMTALEKSLFLAVLKNYIPRQPGQEPDFKSVSYELIVAGKAYQAAVKAWNLKEALAKGVPILVENDKLEDGTPIPGKISLYIPNGEDLPEGVSTRDLEGKLRLAAREAGVDTLTSTYNMPTEWQYKASNRFRIPKIAKAKYNKLRAHAFADGVNLEAESELSLFEVPEGFEDAVTFSFVDLQSPVFGRFAKKEPYPFFAILGATMGHPYNKLVEGNTPLGYLAKWRGSDNKPDPDELWQVPGAWNITNLDETDYNELKIAFENALIYVNVVGKPVFGLNPRDNPKQLWATKIGANAEFRIPSEFIRIPLLIRGGQEGNQRTSLYDIVFDALKSIPNVIHADATSKHVEHFLIPYTRFTTAVQILKKTPGVDVENLKPIELAIASEFRERQNLLDWSNDPKNVLRIPKDVNIRPFQDPGIRFLRGRKYAILGDDRGLGKTLQSIIAADNAVPANLPIIVVTPAKLTTNYFVEIQKFALDKRAVILGNNTTAKDEKGMKKAEEREIRATLRAETEMGFTEAANLFGSRVIGDYNDRYIVEGARTSLNLADAIEQIWQNAKAKKIGIVPVIVKTIPKNVRWVIVSADTMKGENEVYYRLPGVDVPYLISGDYRGEYKALWDALPEDGTPMPADVIADIAKTAKGKESMGGKLRMLGSVERATYLLEKIEATGAVVRETQFSRSMSELMALAQTLPENKLPLTIFDEAHIYRNGSSLEGKEPTALFYGAQRLVSFSAKAWFLTGTPIASNVVDLWALLNLVGHAEGYGENYNEFGMKYAAPRLVDTGRGGKQYVFQGLTNQEQLKQATADVLLWRYKDDVADIPVQVTIERHVQLEDQDLKEWDFNSADPKFLLGEIQEKLAEIARAKGPAAFEEAINAVEEGHKVILFSSFTGEFKNGAWTGTIELFKQWAEEYKESHPDFSFVSVTGKNNMKQVNQAVQAFTEDPDVRLFIGNLQAAGTGLNLQAATYTVFNDVNWVPAYHEQAEDRTRRIGQKECTTTVYIISDAWLDRYVWATLSKRRATIEKVQEGRDDPNLNASDAIDDLEAAAGLSPEIIAEAKKAEAKRQAELIRILGGE